MNGNQRAKYLDDVCPGTTYFEYEWQVIVDVKTGVAYSMRLGPDCGFSFPRDEVAQLIDAGELP
jgi:hypothetical protein